MKHKKIILIFNSFPDMNKRNREVFNNAVVWKLFIGSFPTGVGYQSKRPDTVIVVEPEEKPRELVKIYRYIRWLIRWTLHAGSENAEYIYICDKTVSRFNSNKDYLQFINDRLNFLLLTKNA